ncbi:protein transport protein sec31-like [Sorghum bicolor]|uniref:protein transport protein sec31-like n=1 Tax=Sorghum bicolor TaxID=4558 RepID=UPI00081AE394|nr:protein transport protein sec31-like [Sorghum bicolor]XP_021317394.1 protein transport protein sec31-like [Sorghum bicolor]|eukprot:XP_021317393.1 protein transport protein sec31-like [Sorghum bicolor]
MPPSPRLAGKRHHLAGKFRLPSSPSPSPPSRLLHLRAPRLVYGKALFLIGGTMARSKKKIKSNKKSRATFVQKEALGIWTLLPEAMGRMYRAMVAWLRRLVAVLRRAGAAEASNAALWVGHGVPPTLEEASDFIFDTADSAPRLTTSPATPPPPTGAKNRASTPPPPTGAKNRASTPPPPTGAENSASTPPPLTGAENRTSTPPPLTGAENRASTPPPLKMATGTNPLGFVIPNPRPLI